jgi:crossover junction endodeoxyribonuclease RusA
VTVRREPYPAKKPDVDKLLRAVCDALSGIAFIDDAQIVAIGGTKRWLDPEVPTDVTGAVIRVWPAGKASP